MSLPRQPRTLPTPIPITERSSLLAVPRQSYSSYHDYDSDAECRSIAEVIEDQQTGILPILTLSSNSGAEIIPATCNTPDEHGDFRLPEDETLRIKSTLEDDEEEDKSPFLGGITRTQFRLIFAAILTANFISAFDGTIMASTHSTITSYFGASELASWLSTSFLLTSTSFQPLYGRISDVTGRKSPFVFACAVFTAATVWCALAGNIESFIAARAVCGLGAGGMLTMGAILLSDMVPINVRGTYQSINNLAWGFGSVMGAGSGGYLADTLGWRWEFGIQVPVGIFCIIVMVIVIPAHQPDPDRLDRTLYSRFKDFDFAGSAFLSSSVAFLILGMNLGGNILPWSDWRVIGSLSLALVLGCFLIRTEKRAKSPVMPLQLLTSSPRGNLIFANVLGNITINSVLFNLPLYFQAVMLESATKAGTRLLLPSVAGTIASTVTGLIITATGRVDRTLYFGLATLALGALSICFIQRTFSEPAVFSLLIPCNLGLGFAFVSTLMSVLATSTQADQAVATSTLMMWRTLGSVLGVASSSLIVQNCLVYFLNINVTGDMKEEIIAKVRNRVTAIFELEWDRQQEVVAAYEASLKTAFAWAVVVATCALLLTVGLRLPRLDGKKDKVKEALVGE